MRRILEHVRHNLIAYLALFVALGGTGYAAVNLPAGSVGTRQLRNGAVTARKLDGKSIGGYVLAWAHVGAGGRAESGSPGATSYLNAIGQYNVSWRGIRIPARCAPIATPQEGNTAAPSIRIDGWGSHSVTIDVRDPQGTVVQSPFLVAVVC
jgi:hypothetical protein